MLGTAILHFLAGAAVVVIAASLLTKCADAIAQITKLGRLVVGSIFLALATSLPELTVDLHALKLGLPDLAAGDLLGSSLFNLAILAVADLFTQSRGRMLSRASAAHALSATTSIVLTAIVVAGIASGAQVPPTTVGGVGIWSWAVLGAYLLIVRMVYFDQRLSAQEVQEGTKEPGMKLPVAVGGFLGAAVVIFFAAPHVAESASKIAELSGLGSTFVGTTLVALSTSLPELVATLAAVRLGAFDLALGNIFGSNAFNMILFVPLDLGYPGPLLAAVSPVHVLTGLAVILATGIAVLGQLYHVEKRIRFVEPDAAMVLVVVIGALALLYAIRA